MIIMPSVNIIAGRAGKYKNIKGSNTHFFILKKGVFRPFWKRGICCEKEYNSGRENACENRRGSNTHFFVLKKGVERPFWEGRVFHKKEDYSGMGNARGNRKGLTILFVEGYLIFA